MSHYIFASLMLLLSLHSWADTPIGFTGAHLNQCKMSEQNGEWTFQTTGADGYSVLELTEKINAVQNFILEFEYFAPKGLSPLQIFYGPPISQGQMIQIDDLFPSEGWVKKSVSMKSESGWNDQVKTLRFDFGKKKGVEFRMRRIHLRAPTLTEIQDEQKRETQVAQGEKLKTAISEYLSRGQMTAEITAVDIDGNEVTIKGRLGTEAQNPLLGEVDLNTNWIEESTCANTFKLHHKDGYFKLTLPRYAMGKDRIYSRWVLLDGAAPISYPQYATNLNDASQRKLTRPVVKSIKGVGAIEYWGEEQMQELVELGVRHVTVNIWLDGLFDLEPSNRTVETSINQRNYYVDSSLLKRLDDIIGFATRNHIVVSAIVLITNPLNNPTKEKNEIFMHPDCRSPGLYTMPNLTSARGVRAYQDMYEYIAERYTRENQAYGRIVNWIAHNEIDMGVIWTNCGNKPFEIYLENYHRAMRMLYYAARKFDPTARVFMSLTHYWSKTHAKGSFLPKDFVDGIAKFSELEGDFEWGLAYHPYNEDLRDPKGWLDTNVNHSFNTPLITFKNIEVLDAYLAQPKLLYQGKIQRSILFSEQGFDTPKSTDGELLQAAGLVYAWQRMKNVKSLEAFQYHRWIDHAEEGGLSFGLRYNAPGTKESPGKAKAIFDVFKYLDTPREEEFSRFSLPIIGVSSLQDLRKKQECQEK